MSIHDQSEQALRYCVTQITMLRWQGCLLNIDQTKLEEVMATVAETAVAALLRLFGI